VPFAGAQVRHTRPVVYGAKWACGAVAVALTCALVTGCGQSDEVYQVDMINDTGQPISLGLCANDACSNTDWRESVPTGGTLPANALSDTPTAFVAVLADGTRKCLTVTLESQPKTSYPVTHFAGCPAS